MYRLTRDIRRRTDRAVLRPCDPW